MVTPDSMNDRKYEWTYINKIYVCKCTYVSIQMYIYVYHYICIYREINL